MIGASIEIKHTSRLTLALLRHDVNTKLAETSLELRNCDRDTS